jgi:RNA polymerase-binding transcription factor DksA
MKRCSKCKLEKEESYFYKNKETDKLGSWCKDCLRLSHQTETRKEYQKKHNKEYKKTEKWKTYFKKYRKKNIEKFRERLNDWKKNNPEKVKEYRKKYRDSEKGKEYVKKYKNSDVYTKWKKKKRLLAYGITENELENMKQKQKDKCAICGKPISENFVIDHDHKTGKVRGLLCISCNTGLGHLKDNKVAMLKAIDYLDNKT